MIEYYNDLIEASLSAHAGRREALLCLTLSPSSSLLCAEVHIRSCYVFMSTKLQISMVGWYKKSCWLNKKKKKDQKKYNLKEVPNMLCRFKCVKSITTGVTTGVKQPVDQIWVSATILRSLTVTSRC